MSLYMVVVKMYINYVSRGRLKVRCRSVQDLIGPYVAAGWFMASFCRCLIRASRERRHA